jgi:hypothetical protein
MRSFCTDRPIKADLACTVDVGHFQYESDMLNWTYIHTAGAAVSTFLDTNPTLKLGLTNSVDLELNMAPEETVSAKGALGRQSLTGIGDLFVATKVKIAGPEGGDFQAAILPYVKIPTRDRQQGGRRRGKRTNLNCPAGGFHAADRSGNRHPAQRG